MRRLTALAEELLQRRDVEQPDRAPLHLQMPFWLKARKKPAHCLELQPQIAADLLARHALRKIEQESSKPFFGAHAAEKQHRTVIAGNFARQESVQVLLQRRDAAREHLEVFEWQHEIQGPQTSVVGNRCAEQDAPRHPAQPPQWPSAY